MKLRHLLIRSVLTLVSVVPAFGYAEKVVNLAEGQAQSIQTEKDIGSVFIANPAIADYQVIDQTKVVIFGKTVGGTSLMIFDENGKTLLSKTIVVNKSLIPIQQQIQLHYPDVDVSVYNLGDQVVLSGTVSSEKEKQAIGEMVGELLAKAVTEKTLTWKGASGDSYPINFMTTHTYKGLMNNIEVSATKQVNVKLTIAEVSHSFLEEFGIDLYSAGQSSGIFVDALKRFSASDIISVITATGDDSVGQILAQPNLSVISGESASFLVGGELPLVTVVNDTVNFTYKEYGIRLELVAKVLKDNQIKLALMPEVSSLDEQYANDAYDIPALKTRKARTTVELGDGQSFVLGGLLSSEETEKLSKIPFVGDIPILGALFRHSQTERRKTELVIIATVNLVEPVQESDIQLPTIERTTTLERFFGWRTNHSDQYPAHEVLQEGGFIE